MALSPTENIADLYQEVRRYLRLQKRYYQLETADRLTVLLSRLALYGVCILVGGAALMMCALALAFFLGTLIGSMPLGFLCVAALIAILLGVIYLERRRLIVQPIAKMMVELILKDNEEGKA